MTCTTCTLNHFLAHSGARAAYTFVITADTHIQNSAMLILIMAMHWSTMAKQTLQLYRHGMCYKSSSFYTPTSVWPESLVSGDKMLTKIVE